MAARHARLWALTLLVLGLLFIIIDLHLQKSIHESPSIVQDSLTTFRNNRFTSSTLRPPLDSLVQGRNITGDVSWLLDFSIVGFPKCGTSTLMFNLLHHPEVGTFQDERCENSYNQQAKLVTDLYALKGRIRGIKCPFDLENTKLAMRNYQTYFRNTNYIVGLRHPVLWFESFYNFRIHNEFPMPPPDQLIGRCKKPNFGVCTFRGNFHIFLSNLGKTPMSESEMEWVAPAFTKNRDVFRAPQKVFLYEISQLGNGDVDESRASLFRRDLQSFLGLQAPIQPLVWYKPGVSHDNTTLERVNSKKVDICESQYDMLRSILQEQAVNASHWIRTYFITASNVTVSSRDYLVNVVMKGWEKDPCVERSRRQSSTR